MSSFISKYAIPEPKNGQIITIEQYFAEMEKRAQNSHMGRRGVSTAVPACRQHHMSREHSGEPRAAKAGQECSCSYSCSYSLGPIQLTKAYYNKDSKTKPHDQIRTQGYGKCVEDDEAAHKSTLCTHEDKLKLERVQQIIMEQQSYHDSRPDSRYNQESICTSLDAITHLIPRAPVLTSWKKERSTATKYSPYNNGKNMNKCVKEQQRAPIKMYGQFY